MLDFEKGFKQQIHESWWEPMKPIIESKEVYDIYEYLKAESSRGIKITPKHDCVFKSFQVNLDELKVVVKGLDGYPQIYKGKHYANGRAFCCENYGKVSPSLEKLREGWIDDCKYTTYNKNNLSLKYLEDQGVMLTNAGLCTEKDKPGKYVKLWYPFWKRVYEDLFSKKQDLIFIFLGKEAQRYEKLTVPFYHYSLKTEHPVAASYTNRDWIHNNVFTKTNKLLQEQHKQPIQWLI